MDNKYQNIYIAIDLKSFYASVECQERGLNPLTTNLVVADSSRTEKTICLAVSPSLKQYGIPGRARLYEVVQKVKEINEQRKFNAPNHTFTCSSYDDIALKNNNDLELAYIVAPPRMSYYMQYSTRIVNIYLKWFSMEDIYVYSIDEVFIDVTHYLQTYKMTPRELVTKVIKNVYDETGITATAGIGTNLYLCKIALDIMAKHEKDGIALLTENKYKKLLWHHQPLTDFWHIGHGISSHLARLGIDDMYDLAHYNQDILYKEFGINAEYMIDHAWGREPTTIADIKAYRPSTNSISNSQVLFEDYQYQDALLVLKEMVELNVLKLVDQHLVTNRISLYVGYSKNVIKGTGGQRKITTRTNSLKVLMKEFIELFEERTNKNHPIRQIGISFCDVLDEYYETYDLFSNIDDLEEEKRLQEAIIDIKKHFGKNAVLKGMNKLEKATTEKRNLLIGGHNAK